MESEDENIRSDSSASIPSSSSSEIAFRRVRNTRGILRITDSEEDTINITYNNIQNEWFDPRGNQPQIEPFASEYELRIFETDCCEVKDFFLLLVTEDLLQEIADQTNIYASQVLQEHQSVRLSNWVPTSKEEIKKLFGLIIWMGICKLPEISLYWSRDPLFAVIFPSKVMSRNRFELLLRMVHFSNNNEISIDRLNKIKIIIDTLNENFKKYYYVPENVCIDESIIPFRGRFSFRQYMKQKRHKYGFKIFKLCSKNGYTHRFQIYDGKNSDIAKFTPTNVVMMLSQDIIEKGHTIYVDNWYTSLDLAQQLIKKNTHLVGTIRSNRRGLDKEVVGKKLKPGDIFGKEHKTGITLLKWRDKRDILALSTKHSVDTVNITVKGRASIKPALIVDYNDNKSPVDISDQMTAYYSPLRKTLKWYRKLAFELLLNMAVVNASVLYNTKSNNPISILEYRKKLILYLCNIGNDSYTEEDDHVPRCRKRHELQKDSRKPAKRNRCKSCYAKCVKDHNSQIARNTVKRVTTFCNDCPNKPFLCIPCFNKIHRYMKT